MLQIYQGIFEGYQTSTGSDGEDFSEDDLKQAQVRDLKRILAKANKGTAKFKEYEPADSEEEVDDTDTDSQFVKGSVAQRRPEGTLYFYHPDHLGTSTFLTDMNGDLYQFFLNLPFGETMAEQHSLTADYETPYKFNGKELDSETGLYYYGARYYDPRTSIWLSTDPLMEKYPDVNPYAYCLQNPINYTDPTGMSVDPPPTGLDTPTGTRYSDSTGDWVFNQESNTWQGQNGSSDFSNSIELNEVVINVDNRGFTIGDTGPYGPWMGPDSHEAATGAMSFMAADIAIPEPTDAAPPKWAGYAIVAAICAIILYENNTGTTIGHYDEMSQDAINPKKAAREEGKQARENQPASEKYAKDKAKIGRAHV